MKIIFLEVRELFEQNYPIKHIVLPDTKAMNSSNAIQKAGKKKGYSFLKNKQNRSTELWCNSSALPASPKDGRQKIPTVVLWYCILLMINLPCYLQEI